MRQFMYEITIDNFGHKQDKMRQDFVKNES